ncbi:MULTISPECIES: helix-turn-helix domain-containing protein [Bizionia]|uniref:Helix-turn-helix domain-containing protein n=1 Tax=Bizionia algoritergicola TaxID=291187 RepID=A0A5D0QSD5_9FLAO|nr:MULTISPECIES: helix-turn-helix transcriptional regulator [Bizionia]OBX23228.1 hypothetical protein BAA08_05395 [Bizionia sp. APA-3]TYB71601.1 helix-turn-helix domain-containing protein [Bizionia algoritergicola]
MDDALEKNIKFKIAISLNILLEKRKNDYKNVIKKDLLGDSYNSIALNADIRKATVSNIFNARSNPNSITLISIIEAMGFSLIDFSKIYCSISEKDINKFNNR